MKETTFPLTQFYAFLTKTGASETTAVVYTARVRRILKDGGAKSDDPGQVALSEADIRASIAQMPEGSRAQAVCAWRAFATYAADGGFKIPSLDKGKTRIGGAAWMETAALHPQASVIWELFRLHPGLDPMLVAALRWRHLIWKGPPDPYSAYQAEIRDEGVVYSFRPPMVPLRTLWDWARRDSASAGLDQPLVASERGGQEPIDPAALLAVVRAGKAGRVPRLICESGGAKMAPPPPPVPPPLFRSGT